MKYYVQFGIGMFFFLLLTVATWYEGSELLENPLEWKHSTYFSHMSNNEVTDAKDISQLDFFVYAAKFKPIFPVLMIMNALYLIILLGCLFFKKSKKKIFVFLLIIGGLLLFLNRQLSNTSTVGGEIFNNIFLVTGILCVLVAGIYYFQRRKEFKSRT